MSQRGSFISEFIYCDKCIDVLHDALHGYKLVRGIVGGFIGGLYLGEEAYMMENILGRMADRLCHEARVIVMPESCPPVLLTVKDGEVIAKAWPNDKVFEPKVPDLERAVEVLKGAVSAAMTDVEHAVNRVAAAEAKYEYARDLLRQHGIKPEC